MKKCIPDGEVTPHAANPFISAPIGENKVLFQVDLKGADMTLGVDDVRITFDAAQAMRLSYLFEQAAHRAQGTITNQDDRSFTVALE
jgi:hypothetical protein